MFAIPSHINTPEWVLHHAKAEEIWHTPDPNLALTKYTDDYYRQRAWEAAGYETLAWQALPDDIDTYIRQTILAQLITLAILSGRRLFAVLMWNQYSTLLAEEDSDKIRLLFSNKGATDEL